MRLTRATLITVGVTLCVLAVSSLPVQQYQGLIPASQDLDRMVMAEAENEAALRSKRTIGVLRQLFPGATQIIERTVGMITSELFRVLGPIFLRSALGGGGRNAGSNNDAGTTVTVASPFGDDDDDNGDGNEISSMSQSGTRVSISLPTFPSDEEDPLLISTNSTSKEPSDVNPEAENLVGAESQNNEVRVQFSDDQSGSAANDAVAPELAPLDDVEVSDDNRNKRFLNFGGDASSGGSGGGSGNFLFDIIRQTADGAARAAGTVYRVVAGTQSLGLGLSASRELGPAPAPAVAAAPATAPAPAAAPAPANGSVPPPPPGNASTGPGLVAGSGSTEQGDAAANAPLDPGRAIDGNQEAVPGPVTRLFVIANRGISNLIQDLILRLAATSERIVNFKARLITSII